MAVRSPAKESQGLVDTTRGFLIRFIIIDSFFRGVSFVQEIPPENDFLFFRRQLLDQTSHHFYSIALEKVLIRECFGRRIPCAFARRKRCRKRDTNEIDELAPREFAAAAHRPPDFLI